MAEAEKALNTKNVTVAGLRKLGYKVGVRHTRIPGESLTILSNSGRLITVNGFTEVQITDPSGDRTEHGMAACSLMDQYNHRIGQRAATGRAWLKMLGSRN